MKNLIIIIFIMLLENIVFGQLFEDSLICGNCCDTTTVFKSSSLSFIDISDEQIKHVRVNFIFLRKDNGTAGFQENNSDHQQYISDMINNLNSIYSNIPSSYDNTCYDGS